VPQYETPLSIFTAFGQEKAPKGYGSVLRDRVTGEWKPTTGGISWTGHPKEIDVLPQEFPVPYNWLREPPLVTGNMMLDARDRYLARPDLTEEAKQVIKNSPITADPTHHSMSGNVLGITYGPYVADPRYQDPDQLAGVFGHEAMHLLDHYYGLKTSNPITEYVRWRQRESGPPLDYLTWLREIVGYGWERTGRYLPGVAGKTDFQDALLLAAEQGYDPTDVTPLDTAHRYTYFGEQAPYMIPPPLRQYYPMFNEEAFELPEGLDAFGTGRRTVTSISELGELGYENFDYDEYPYVPAAIPTTRQWLANRWPLPPNWESS